MVQHQERLIWPAPPARSFVGRAAPLAVLQRSLDEALAGKPRAVLIEGDAGIGKSRLAAELLDRGRRRGAIILAGRCSEDLDVPYLALATALDPLGGELDAQLLDPGGTPGPALDPTALMEQRTAEPLVAACRAAVLAARRRPIVLAPGGPPLGRPAHRRAARAARHHVVPRRHAGVDGDPLRRHAATTQRTRRPHRRTAAARAGRPLAPPGRHVRARAQRADHVARSGAPVAGAAVRGHRRDRRQSAPRADDGRPAARQRRPGRPRR